MLFMLVLRCVLFCCFLLFILFILILIILILFICMMVVGGFAVGMLKSKRRRNAFDEDELQETEENEFSMNYREIPFTELMMKKEIGKGSSGRVFKGIWRHAPVAIKCMSLDLNEESTLLEWRKELEIMTKLGNHPNILPFLGACTTRPGALYFVTKFCDLGSLH